MEALYFNAAVQAVKTLADGGIRVTFDLPEDAIDTAAALMRFKRGGQPLRVACVVNEPDTPAGE